MEFPDTGRCWPRLALVCLLCLLPSFATAQTEAARPRIGLVLGGGGARGAAHIGVLQVLQENRIPVDYIGGTSMGAIVGALYAMGLSPAEIETRLLALDWSEVFTDNPERNRRTLRHKREEDAGFLPLEFGIRNRSLILSRGLIAGQKFAFAFGMPAFHTAGLAGFDNLAYPFRCVATDLRDGRRVVLDHGSLLQCVRASMSIPGLFPPVIIDGAPLVDGGVVWNVPVDMVRGMGADIVIAVDVGASPEDTPPQLLEILPGILEQTYHITLQESVREELARADHVIRVRLDGIGAQDFRKVQQTLEPGRAAAHERMGELAIYSLDPAAYAEHLAAHRPAPVAAIRIDRIEIINHSVASEAAIRRTISQPLGQPLDLPRLQRDLESLYDYGVFELVDFTIVASGGVQTLQITGRGAAVAPWILQGGFRLIAGQDSRSEVTAKLRMTRLEMNGYGGQWRNTIQLGRIQGLKSSYYQPLAASRRPFLVTDLVWREAKQDFYANRSYVGQYTTRGLEYALDLGVNLGHTGELRAGYRAGHLQSLDPTIATLPDFDLILAGYTGRLAIDTFDSGPLPRHGFGAGLDLFAANPGLGSDLDYTRITGNLRAAASWGKTTFSLGLRGGEASGDAPVSEEFTLGGLHRLAGFRDDQLRDDVFGLASLGIQRRIHDSPGLFPVSWHLGLEFEAGNVWPSRGAARIDDLQYALTLSLTAITWLGPTTVANGWNINGENILYLQMGREFDLLK